VSEASADHPCRKVVRTPEYRDDQAVQSRCGGGLKRGERAGERPVQLMIRTRPESEILGRWEYESVSGKAR